jgi:cytochrome c oxidase subunit 2
MFSLNQPAGQSLNVQVVGHQWWWEFDYENAHIITADQLVVPVGTVVHLDLKSDNVIHSFWVPQLTGKTDVVPGHANTKWFQADTVGTYRGLCAEFCGLQHANMQFEVTALSLNDYNTWLINQQQNATTAASVNAKDGLALFSSEGCIGCHGIVGVNLHSFNDPAASALIGPNLTHFGSRNLIAGGVLSWSPQSCQVVGTGDNAHIVNQDSCGLYKWLHDPQAIKPGNDMNIGQLSDTQIAQLVAYLESLT